MLGLLFHSVCSVFIWGKKDLCKLFSPGWSLHYINSSLKTSEDTQGTKRTRKVSIREKCSFKQCLEGEAEQRVLWRSWLRHTVNLHYSLSFLWYTAQHFRARSPAVHESWTQRPLLAPNQETLHTGLLKTISSTGVSTFLSLPVNPKSAFPFKLGELEKFELGQKQEKTWTPFSSVKCCRTPASEWISDYRAGCISQWFPLIRDADVGVSAALLTKVHIVPQKF